MAPKKKKQKHNLDQKRLSLLLRYFKEHDALIELKNDHGDKFIYSFKQNDGNPSIRSLLRQEPLNLSKNSVKELFLDWPMDNEHSYKKRVRENLKIIEGVTFYLDSDGRVDESTNKLRSTSSFGVRGLRSGILELKLGEEAFEKDDFGIEDIADETQDCDPYWGQYLGDLFEEYPDYVDLMIRKYTALDKLKISNLFSKSVFLSFDEKKHHDFKYDNILEKLAKIYPGPIFFLDDIKKIKKTNRFHEKLIETLEEIDLDKKERAFEKILNKTLKEALEIYSDFRFSDDRNGYLLANYRDFCIPENIQLSEKFREFSSRSGLGESILSGDIDISWAIEHRYELVHWHVQSDMDINNWHPLVYSILILICFEHKAFNILLEKSLDRLVNDTRFIILGAKEQGDIDYQKNSLGIYEISNLLSGYFFQKGLEETLKQSKFNLLQHSIFRYPRKEGVKSRLSEEEIHYRLESILRSYYLKNVLSDNFINSEFLKRMFKNK